jgi:hypothetical protein
VDEGFDGAEVGGGAGEMGEDDLFSSQDAPESNKIKKGLLVVASLVETRKAVPECVSGL